MVQHRAFAYNLGIIFRVTRLTATTNQTAVLDGAAVSDPKHQISAIWAFCSILMWLTIKKTSSAGGFWQWKMSEKDVERSVAWIRRGEEASPGQEEEHWCKSAACAAARFDGTHTAAGSSSNPHLSVSCLHGSLQIFDVIFSTSVPSHLCSLWSKPSEF